MKLPSQLSDIQNMNMVLFYDNDNSIPFGHVSSLLILAYSQVILEDETFNIVNNYDLLFIFHGQINEKILQLFVHQEVQKNINEILGSV